MQYSASMTDVHVHVHSRTGQSYFPQARKRGAEENTPFTCVEIYVYTCIYIQIYIRCVVLLWLAVCLTLLASSFLFSTSLIKTCMYRYMYMYLYNTCIYSSVHAITFGHRTISDQYTHVTDYVRLWSVKMSERAITRA